MCLLMLALPVQAGKRVQMQHCRCIMSNVACADVRVSTMSSKICDARPDRQQCMTMALRMALD